MVAKATFVIVLLVLAVVGGVGSYAYFSTGPCQQKASETTTAGIKPTSFGAVTEYSLPGAPWANAIAAAPDGSIWFGEQGRPGVAHLVQKSGMLTQYEWPCYPRSNGGGVVSSIWGVVSWNGRIWAADGDANRLVGLDPMSDGTIYVNTTSARFPYLLTPAPDGSLWFTALSTPAKVGVLSPSLNLTLYPVLGLGHEEPIQIQFVNSTFAYMVALNPYVDKDSGLYSFDPRAAGGSITVTKVGGQFQLLFPEALSLGDGRIWIAQHYPSDIVSYDPSNGEWTAYPTSRVSYSNTTLPYFIGVEGGMVWFNEHYANRIAMLNPVNETLTEYSESDPPPSTYNGIQNDLTIATTPEGVWFTSTTSSYVGFLKSGAHPNFTLSVSGSHSAALTPGSTLTERFEVSGSWSSPLTVGASDSETITAIPEGLMIIPSQSTLSAGSGPATFTVSIGTNASIIPGVYTLAVTVTDGLLSQSVYLFLTVGN